MALFSTNFLAYSQTFVYEELRCLSRYRAEVFCRRRLRPDQFPFEPVHVGRPLYGWTRRDRSFDRCFRSTGFALIHAHFGLGAVYAHPFAQRHRLPLVVTFHGYDVPLLTSPTRWRPHHLRYALLGPRVLHDMTLGLCASTELQSMLLEQGVPPERLRVHRLGIDLERFQPGPRRTDRCEVAMVGRFVEKKGFTNGLAAFATVAWDRPQLRLTLVGDGPLAGALRRQAAALRLGEQVEFVGPLPADRVAALLASTDVLLAPSVVDREGNRESGLIVVKEASACGAVPIGTRHGGIPEIIEDGVTGYLVAEHDIAAMAARLAQVAQDPSLRAALGEAGRRKMRREYDVRERVRALEGHYDEAQARYTPPS